MLTDAKIIEIAKGITKEDEASVTHILDVLDRAYLPIGNYGLSIMLYAVAYADGKGELEGGRDDVRRRIMEKSAAEEFMFRAAFV